MSSVETAVSAQAAATPDAALAAAVEVARAAAAEVAAGPGAGLGEHLGVRAEAGLVATHAFAAAVPGYVGWHWAVTVARVEDSVDVTVDEVVLLPGDGALLAPTWVPWDERVRPGDLAPGDLLPAREDDPRLVPAYAAPGDPDGPGDDDPAADAQVSDVAFELGLGRERVMSRDGRLDAAHRWQAGDRGPGTAMARSAPASCGTCGFFLSLAGSLRAAFGVCGNEVTDSDGQVVSVEYGCGAHSQTVVEQPAHFDIAGVVYDDGDDVEATPPAEPDAATDAGDGSDGAAEAPVAVHDGPAEQAEQPAGEAGPQPDAVVVAPQPAPEGQ